MNYKEITPVMTSNSEPSPYNISASSQLSEANAEYMVLDGLTNTEWKSELTDISVSYPNIIIDLGCPFRIDKIDINLKTSIVNDQIKEISIYGSQDNSIWYDIILNQEVLLSSDNTLDEYHSIEKFIYYRYLKIEINDSYNNSAGEIYGVISELRLFRNNNLPAYRVQKIKGMLTDQIHDTTEIGCIFNINEFGNLFINVPSGTIESFGGLNMPSRHVIYDGSTSSLSVINSGYKLSDFRYIIIYLTHYNYHFSQIFKYSEEGQIVNIHRSNGKIGFRVLLSLSEYSVEILTIESWNTSSTSTYTPSIKSIIGII